MSNEPIIKTDNIPSLKFSYEELEKKQKQIEETVGVAEKNTQERNDLLSKFFKENTPKVNLSNVKQLLTKGISVKEWNSHKHNEKEIADIRKENISNFYTQIVNNLTMGHKSIFLVCRDLKDAHRQLETNEFNILKEMLPISESTINKYIKIGGSDVCRELYNLNKLPEVWTTLYYISRQKLDDSSMDHLIDFITPKTTQKEVMEYLNGPTDEKPKSWNYVELKSPRDFLKVAIEGNLKQGNIDPNTMLYIKNKVEEVVSDALNEMTVEKLGYKPNNNDLPIKCEVVTNTSLIETVKKFVLNNFENLKSKKLKKLYEENFFKKFSQVNNPIFNK
jgi:hypothetical protein